MSRISSTLKSRWVFATLLCLFVVGLPLSGMAVEPGPGQSLKGPAALLDVMVTSATNGGIDLVFSGSCANNTISMNTANVSAISYATVVATEGQVFKDLEIPAGAVAECNDPDLSAVVINVHGFSDNGSNVTLDIVALFNHG